MTTNNEIKEWFVRGKDKGASRMIVVCDTFDYEDYPVYCDVGEVGDAVRKYSNTNNMSRVMEVYDLNMNMEDQLSEHRAYHL